MFLLIQWLRSIEVATIVVDGTNIEIGGNVEVGSLQHLIVAVAIAVVIVVTVHLVRCAGNKGTGAGEGAEVK